jgi:hypothetical protein
MNTPNQLDRALEALRQEHRSIHPPPSLEASILRQAELSTPHHTHTVHNWSLAFAAAAALAIAVVLLYPRPSHPSLDARITPVEPPKAIQTSTPPRATTQPTQPHRLSRPRGHTQPHLAITPPHLIHLSCCQQE